MNKLIPMITVALLAMSAFSPALAQSQSSSFGVGITILPDHADPSNIPAAAKHVDQVLPEYSHRWTQAYNEPQARQEFFDWGVAQVSKCLQQKPQDICQLLRQSIVRANKLIHS